MIKRITENNLVEVGKSILLYNKAGGKEIKGLSHRRKKEHDLFLPN